MRRVEQHFFHYRISGVAVSLSESARRDVADRVAYDGSACQFNGGDTARKVRAIGDDYGAVIK